MAVILLHLTGKSLEFRQGHSHSLPLFPLSHSFCFICIFPDLHRQIEVELGSFSATDELITPVKKFCLSRTQMKSKIILSLEKIKTGIGKKDWVHNKAFQIWAAFRSYWTVILNARALLHESSLHPKHRQSSRKQIFHRSFPAVPLFSYTFLYYWTYFLPLPMIFSVLFLYHPLLFSFLVQCKAVPVPLETLALVSVNFFPLLVQRAVNLSRHNITRLFIPPVSLCFYRSRGSRKQNRGLHPLHHLASQAYRILQGEFEIPVTDTLL